MSCLCFSALLYIRMALCFDFWLGPDTVKFRVCVVIADMQSSNKSTNISPRTAAHPHSPSTSASPRYGEKQHVK